MLAGLIETSNSMLLVKKLWSYYYSIELWFDRIYRDSYTHRLIERLFSRIRLCFEYSFLGRITEIKEQENIMVLDNSKVIRRLINLWREHKDKLIHNLDTSVTVESLKEINKNIRILPVKVTSIIVISATIVNLTLLVAVNRKVGLDGLTVRVLFLSVGLAGLFCKADWSAVKSSSLILRIILAEQKR